MSTTQRTRKITVYSSRGQKATLDTDATNFGAIYSWLKSNYEMSNLQAVESVNKTTLSEMESRLPEGDFVIFLRPVRTKSGANFEDMSFTELRQQLTEEDKQAIQRNFGRNWTNMSYDNLLEYLNAKKELSSSKDNSKSELSLDDHLDALMSGALDMEGEEGLEFLSKISEECRKTTGKILLKKLMSVLCGDCSEDEDDSKSEDDFSFRFEDDYEEDVLDGVDTEDLSEEDKDFLRSMFDN